MDTKKEKNWKNLQEMLCPECSTNLQKDNVFDQYVCMSYDCNFKISEAKFDRLIRKLYNPEQFNVVDEVEDNLSGLSNL